MAETSSFYQHFCIEWNITNHLAVEKLESEVFHLDGAVWKLIFESNFIDYRKRYGFMLKKIKPAGSLHEFLLKTFAEDKNKKRHLVDNTHLVILDCVPVEIRWIWNEELRHKNKELIVNKAVNFVFAFKNMRKSETDVSVLGDELNEKTVIVQNDDCLEALSADLRKYLDNGGVQSDVTLKCGNKKILAHRNILAARSEVFSKQFKKDMEEKRDSVMKLANVHPTICNMLLEYIYSGKISELTVDIVLELYSAAEKYGITPLKIRCHKFMKESLTTRHACKFLAFADEHNDQDLKEYVFSFIVKTELFKDDDIFQKFHEEHPKLCAELIHRAYKEKC